jgi:type II secretory pathway component PulC
MEGEFERSTSVVSNGCETSMKKFNFNFKFLERFKKTKSDDSSEDTETQVDDLDLTDEESSNEEGRFVFQEMPRSSQSEDATLTKSQIIVEDEGFSDDNPEDFAEKTLSNINLDKFREENQHLINDNIGEDATDTNMAFSEMEKAPIPSSAPEKSKSRFKINFPKFGKSSFEDWTGSFKKPNFKNRFSDSPIKSLDKFSWNDFVLKLFSPYTRVKVHGVFVILLVVTFTYLVGKGTALFLGRSTPVVSVVKSNINMPIEKTDSTLQDINRISQTNLFNIKESDKTETKKEHKDINSIICLDAERPTTEPLKLLDTIVLQDSVKSVASVQVRGSSDLVNVREGEQINNAVEVSKITRMKIILKNLSTGECEYIASDDEEAPAQMPNIQIMSKKQAKSFFKSTNPMIKNTGNNFKIKRQFRDKMISNMSEVLTQAKAIQITNPDGSLAFKMTEVVPGSIYSQLNIQNDDIITSINGKKIENLNELMSLMGRIKEIDAFQIGLKRNGMNENLEYGFE